MEYWKDHTRTLNEQVGYFGYSLRLKSYSFHDSETNKVLIVDQDILDKEGNYVSTLRYDFRGVNENNPASKITECVKNIGNEDNKGESRTERHFQNNPIDDGN